MYQNSYVHFDWQKDLSGRARMRVLIRFEGSSCYLGIGSIRDIITAAYDPSNE